jgi:predicted outer membrane lipoprotein
MLSYWIALVRGLSMLEALEVLSGVLLLACAVAFIPVLAMEVMEATSIHLRLLDGHGSRGHK